MAVSITPYRFLDSSEKIGSGRTLSEMRALLAAKLAAAEKREAALIRKLEKAQEILCPQKIAALFGTIFKRSEHLEETE